MMKYLMIVIISFLSSTVVARELPNFPFVSVMGEAERKVTPDFARLSLRSMVYDEVSKVAMDKNRETMNRVFTILKSYDIDRSTIEASDVSKQEKRDRGDRYQDLKVLGYEVSRSLTFELRNLEQYSELVISLNSIDFVVDVSAQFDTKNRNEIESELLDQASRKAREKAEVMAKSTETKIASVFGISQDRDFSYRGAKFGYPDMEVSAMAPMDNPQRMSVFIPKSITLTQLVNVLYQLK